jgi:hypothetical protein
MLKTCLLFYFSFETDNHFQSTLTFDNQLRPETHRWPLNATSPSGNLRRTHMEVRGNISLKLSLAIYYGYCRGLPFDQESQLDETIKEEA